MDQANNGLHPGDARADEDGRHDRQARAPLGQRGAQRKRDAQRHGCQGVAEVVDQISQQRDAAAGDEHDRLGDRGEPENRERQRDGADAVVGALDAVVDEPVGVPMGSVVGVLPAGIGPRAWPGSST